MKTSSLLEAFAWLVIITGLTTLSKNEEDVDNSKKSVQWKLALASWMPETWPRM
jgi:hypothetical protein